MPITANPISVYANLPSNAGIIPTIQVNTTLSNKFFWAIKPGGVLNQILVKNSETDYDTSWVDNPAASVSADPGNIIELLPDGFYADGGGDGGFYGPL